VQRCLKLKEGVVSLSSSSSYHDIEFNQLASAQLFPPFDQMPLLIQASSSNGFASYLCAGSGLQNPVPTVLSFRLLHLTPHLPLIFSVKVE
jgi:hypothetical protein